MNVTKKYKSALLILAIYISSILSVILETISTSTRIRVSQYENEMITQLSKEIQCHHTISTKGLDILCIAAELDELESSDESTNYCTLVENSSNNNVNVANQRKPSKKSVCSFDGCEKNAQYKGLCRGHGKVRFVLLHYVNLCVQ